MRFRNVYGSFAIFEVFPGVVGLMNSAVIVNDDFLMRLWRIEAFRKRIIRFMTSHDYANTTLLCHVSFTCNTEDLLALSDFTCKSISPYKPRWLNFMWWDWLMCFFIDNDEDIIDFNPMVNYFQLYGRTVRTHRPMIEGREYLGIPLNMHNWAQFKPKK